MSALAEQRWEVDPDALAAAALQAPRCRCDRPILDEYRDCERCGREIRPEGSLSRAFRAAAYDRRLRWARGLGLNPRTGFLGLHGEVGCNPALELLDAALCARVEALTPAQGDPFEGDDLAELMVAA